MNSLVRVFTNFKDFYGEINGATLTGAIDIIVVEQPDGEFLCSPFHVRFGKLGVLRSREKVVDIEINGEPVDIHMKLGDSGEAFFVEEIPEEEIEKIPDNLATSPIPTSFFPQNFGDDTLPKERISDELPMPLPRRNSIDFSKESAKAETEPLFENQVSDYSHRRHTDNTLVRSNLSDKVKEYTTQKIRQEWAEHEEIFQFDAIDNDKDWSNSTQSEQKQAKPAVVQPAEVIVEAETTLTSANIAKPEVQTVDVAAADIEELEVTDAALNNTNNQADNISIKEESKGKKKRRKRSQLKKKNTQRKSSSSSSIASNAAAAIADEQNVEADADISISISNATLSSTNEEKDSSRMQTAEQSSAALTKTDAQLAGDDSPISENGETPPITPTARHLDLDIHFFSDTEVTSSGGNVAGGGGRGAGRPSTPIQSDSELEISMREKDADVERMSNSAKWKWGELPTPELIEQSKTSGENAQTAQQAERNSMLSGMFNFMRKTNKMRQQVNNDGGVYLSDLDAEGMDPQMAALYFPSAQLNKAQLDMAAAAAPANILHGSANANEDDRESGNGTSLPHSPSSMEGQKSIDSDYEDGKAHEANHLDFVAMSLCGLPSKGEPTDADFNRHLIKYKDVCANPTLFSSAQLVVRMNGKYYSWAAACPIVMTMITFQKPLTDEAIEHLMMPSKCDASTSVADIAAAADKNQGEVKRSWWYWRRSQSGTPTPINATDAVDAKGFKLNDKIVEKDAEAGTQTSRPNSPDVSENTLSKTDSTLNAENTSAMLENMEDLSSSSAKIEANNSSINNNTNNKNERFKKSLRISSEAIKKLNLNEGMNKIEFSVTTAYQGTTRCNCYLFRWKHSDKVVISDIDGTITRSDVLGHILPMVGKDWAQLGVAELFSKIEQNGYKLLYLSARAIGQSRATREYLQSIRQGDVMLPNGPLLLNPTSLLSALHREVIEKKPEQFKIACLSDIRDLFPERNPFYAGYGNRINDVWAYRAVGMPTERIFTINAKGELKHELTQTFLSSNNSNAASSTSNENKKEETKTMSYSSMTIDADQFFPPTQPAVAADVVEYSNFNFWRDPIPELVLDLEMGATALNVSSKAEDKTRDDAATSKP